MFYTWDKVFKSGPRKICGRQPLNYLKGYGRLWSTEPIRKRYAK